MDDVDVAEFARVFVKEASQLPAGTNNHFDRETGRCYFKLDFDSLEKADTPVTKVLSELRKGYDVEIVHRVEADHVIKERRYVESPEDVPDGYKVEQGAQGGTYYETNPTNAPQSSVSSQDGVGYDGQPVYAVLSDFVSAGDEVAFERDDGQRDVGAVAEVHDDHVTVETGDGSLDVQPAPFSSRRESSEKSWDDLNDQIPFDYLEKSEIELPTVCRKCDGSEGRTRMEGAFLCPKCAEESSANAWEDFDAEEDDYELAKEGDGGGDGGTVTSSTEGVHNARHSPDDDDDEKEEDLGLAGDIGKAFDADIYRVSPGPESDIDAETIGIAVDMPNHEVYVDWKNDEFPDALDNAHVSIYGSIADLEQATGNDTELVDSMDVSEKVAKAESARLEKDDNWVSYVGPQGGEGWLNLQTCEVRYQAERPGEGPEEEAIHDGWNPYESQPEEIPEGVDIQFDQMSAGSMQSYSGTVAVNNWDDTGKLYVELENGGSVYLADDAKDTDWGDWEINAVSDMEVEEPEDESDGSVDLQSPVDYDPADHWDFEETESPNGSPQYSWKDSGAAVQIFPENFDDGVTYTVAAGMEGDTEIVAANYDEDEIDEAIGVAAYAMDHMAPAEIKQIGSQIEADDVFTAAFNEVEVPGSVYEYDWATDMAEGEKTPEEHAEDSITDNYDWDDVEVGQRVTMIDGQSGEVIEAPDGEFETMEVENDDGESLTFQPWEIEDLSEGPDDEESAYVDDADDPNDVDPDPEQNTQPEVQDNPDTMPDPSGGSWLDHVGDYDVTKFNEDDFDEWGSLSEFGFPSGVSGAHMDVGALPEYDGESNKGLVFRRKFGDDALDPETGHRQMVAYTIGDALGGQMPTHAGHADEDGQVVANGVDGHDIGSAPDEVLEQVDDDHFIEQAAVQIILGNNDAHMQNVKVTPDGDVVFHDIDHAAGDITSDFVGEKGYYDNSLDRVLGELYRSAQYVVDGGEEEVKQRMLDAATELAKEHQNTGANSGDDDYETFADCVEEESDKDDPDAFCASIFFGGDGDNELAQALQSAVDHSPELVQNVQNNIQNLAQGNATW